MSENEVKENQEQVESSTETTAPQGVKLNGLYAFKVGMSSVYRDSGEAVPVTVLKYDPWIVSQIKSQEKDGYSAVQIACRPKKAKNTAKSESGHLKASGVPAGMKVIREFRQDLPEAVELGQKVLLESLEKGDVVRITGRSKGRGFAGGMKRHGFGGGPASHGSGFHRRPGSSGNRTWPGQVLAGKRMPGHYGDKTVTVKGVEIVDVIPEESVVLVRGPVPGARNSLVKLIKE